MKCREKFMRADDDDVVRRYEGVLTEGIMVVEECNRMSV